VRHRCPGIARHIASAKTHPLVDAYATAGAFGSEPVVEFRWALKSAPWARDVLGKAAHFDTDTGLGRHHCFFITFGGSRDRFGLFVHVSAVFHCYEYTACVAQRKTPSDVTSTYTYVETVAVQYTAYNFTPDSLIY